MTEIPILKLRSILITSIQTELTDEEAIKFQASLLKRNEKERTRGIIIDISVLDVVDSYMAKVLTDLTLAVKLQGSRVVLCGVQPAVASTLVDMGMDLSGMRTFLSLDHAFNFLSIEPSRQLET